LQDDHESLMDNLQYTENHNDELKAETNKLQQETKALQAELEKVKNDVAEQGATNQSLRAEMENIMAENTSNDDKAMALLSEKQELQYAMDLQSEQLQEAQKELNDAKTEIESGQSAIKDLKMAEETLQGSLADVRRAFQEQQAKYSEKQNQCQELSNEVQERIEQIQSLEKDVNLQNKKIDSLEQWVKETEIATQETCQELEQEMEGIQKTLADKQEELSAKQEEMTNLQHQVTEKTQELNSLRSEFSALQTSSESEKSEFSTKLQDTTDQLSLLQTKYDQTVDELNQNIKKLEETNSQNEAEVDGLNATVADSRVTVGQLRDQKDKLEQQLSSVQKFLSECQEDDNNAENSSVLASLDAFKAQFTELKEANPLHQEQVKALESRVEDLQMEINTTKSKLTQAHKELEKLQQQLTAASQKLTETTAALECKTAEFVALTSTTEADAVSNKELIENLQKEVSDLSKSTSVNQIHMSVLRKQLSKAEEDLAAEKVAAGTQIKTLSDKLRASQDLLGTHAADADAQTFEAARLAAQVKMTTEKLKQSLKDKEQWLEDMNRCREEEERAHEECEKVRYELENSKVLIRKHEREALKVNEEAVELRKVNAKLIGHQNPKQKIQHHMKIKTENDKLKQDKSALEREIRRYRMLMKKEGIQSEANKENSSAAANVSEEVFEDDLSDKYKSLSKKQSTMNEQLKFLVDGVRGFMSDDVAKSKSVDGEVNDMVILKSVLEQFEVDRQQLIKVRRELTVKERELNMLEAQNKLKQESLLLGQACTSVEDEEEFVDSAGFFSKQ